MNWTKRQIQIYGAFMTCLGIAIGMLLVLLIKEII